jgi:hypothetical protein
VVKPSQSALAEADFQAAGPSLGGLGLCDISRSIADDIAYTPSKSWIGGIRSEHGFGANRAAARLLSWRYGYVPVLERLRGPVIVTNKWDGRQYTRKISLGAPESRDGLAPHSLFAFIGIRNH